MTQRPSHFSPARRLGRAAVAALVPFALYGCAGAPSAPADAGADRPAVAAPAAPVTVSVAESNPAFAVGVRGFRLTPSLLAGSPDAARATINAEAFGADGATLYALAIEQRLDLMTAWAQRARQNAGAVGAPTADELAQFLGTPSVTPGPGADASDEALARALGGLVVASATPGGPRLTAAAEGVCVSQDEASSNVASMQGAMAICLGEIAVGAAGGPWATAAVFIAASLAGGAGCTSIYGLLCDQLALVYRASCCAGADLNYDRAKLIYGIVCPLGDKVPEPATCPLCPDGSARLAGGACCPPGTTPEGGACACPAGMALEGDRCIHAPQTVCFDVGLRVPVGEWLDDRGYGPNLSCSTEFPPAQMSDPAVEGDGIACHEGITSLSSIAVLGEPYATPAAACEGQGDRWSYFWATSTGSSGPFSVGSQRCEGGGWSGGCACVTARCARINPEETAKRNGGRSYDFPVARPLKKSPRSSRLPGGTPRPRPGRREAFRPGGRPYRARCSADSNAPVVVARPGGRRPDARAPA
jgi:hypothetical protein